MTTVHVDDASGKATFEVNLKYAPCRVLVHELRKRICEKYRKADLEPRDVRLIFAGKLEQDVYGVYYYLDHFGVQNDSLLFMIIRLSGTTMSYDPWKHGRFGRMKYAGVCESNFEPTTVSDVVYCTEQDYADIMERHRSTGVYPNLSNPRGRAVIFNNVEFSPESRLRRREGSNIDSRHLRALFRAMHYDVTVHVNQTASGMLNLLRNERENPDLVHHSSFILVILSHGADMDMICGVDGSLVKCNQITDMLNNQNCPNLFGKPKLIIFQACRGVDVDEGAHGISHGETTDASVVRTIHLPSQADMVIAFSTTPNSVSYRNELRGSWFIQDLVKVFRHHVHDKDVLTLLTKVNNDLATRTDIQTGTRKQGSVTITQLRKAFYFWPGLYSNDGGRTLTEFHN